jgi:hypothetical protein
MGLGSIGFSTLARDDLGIGDWGILGRTLIYFTSRASRTVVNIGMVHIMALLRVLQLENTLACNGQHRRYLPKA